MKQTFKTYAECNVQKYSNYDSQDENGFINYSDDFGKYFLGAAVVFAVDGGFMGFYTVTDAQIFENQK